MSAPTLTTSTLDIGGMTCASCVRRVEKALSRVGTVGAAPARLLRDLAGHHRPGPARPVAGGQGQEGDRRRDHRPGRAGPEDRARAARGPRSGHPGRGRRRRRPRPGPPRREGTGGRRRHRGRDDHRREHADRGEPAGREGHGRSGHRRHAQPHRLDRAPRERRRAGLHAGADRPPGLRRPGREGPDAAARRPRLRLVRPGVR